MVKLIRSLRFLDRRLLTEKEKQMKCEKCGKRLATGLDNLCDHCRFDDALTRMVK